ECAAIFTNSRNVSKRLKSFNNFDSIPLYHPPQNAELFYCEQEQGYFFFPSRLTRIKRQELVIEALGKTTNPVKIVFAGKPDEDAYTQQLLNLAKNLHIENRVVFLGGISEEEKIKYYAEALGVIYPPFDEDYGYVTLEAMLASKPVITCSDSGGPLEFISHEETGLVAEPTPAALASAMDYLWESRSWAKAVGQAALEYYNSLNITWFNVLKKLLA
ncbi:MAG: glycosyltransferase family 4 protein, partial [Brasilonema sp.]